MTQVESNSQGSMNDRVLEDLELEELLDELKELEADAKRFRKVRKQVKQKIEEKEFPPDTRVRCGRFVIEVKERAGGGVEIPPWNKTVVGKISEVGG